MKESSTKNRNKAVGEHRRKTSFECGNERKWMMGRLRRDKVYNKKIIILKCLDF